VSKSAVKTVVFIDADNTLWDTNRVYADAQLALLADVEIATGFRAPEIDKLDWLRAIDQFLAEKHHAGLRYPPRLLAKAVALALKGQDPATAARFAWSGGQSEVQLDEDSARKIEEEFLKLLKALPPLREGVAEGLRLLHTYGFHILVLTEGNRERVVSLLEHFHLGKLVARVMEVKKERQLFDRVLALAHHPSAAFMVGDQLDRDIAPAKAAGLKTIYFPGQFRPKWQPLEDDIQPDYRVENFNKAAQLIINATREKAALASSR
jgi:putative hydrolase of the HAD superfamily